MPNPTISKIDDTSYSLTSQTVQVFNVEDDLAELERVNAQIDTLTNARDVINGRLQAAAKKGVQNAAEAVG